MLTQVKSLRLAGAPQVDTRPIKERTPGVTIHKTTSSMVIKRRRKISINSTLSSTRKVKEKMSLLTRGNTKVGIRMISMEPGQTNKTRKSRS